MYKIIIVLFSAFFALNTHALELKGEVSSFASNMESCYGVPGDKVSKWLEGTSLDPLALSRMDRQTESKSWGHYKPLFITEAKIRNGFAFYLENYDTLKRAEKQFGVSSYVITAILGVETDYGRFNLKHRAVDTLATLAFYYPRRASFFSNELKHLFMLADEEDSNPLEFLSSYAGAVGMPQFMPSNIKKFGVDFDGDGKINLVSSKEDAIASIANYLKKSGFRNGRPIAVQADVFGDEWKEYANKGLKPKKTAGELMLKGIIPTEDVLPDRKASFYELKKTDEESEYWLFFDNFYAVSRYNPSVSYTLAVTLLSFEIKRLDESF